MVLSTGLQQLSMLWLAWLPGLGAMVSQRSAARSRAPTRLMSTNEVVNFPAPLSVAGRAARNADFWRRAAPIVARLAGTQIGNVLREKVLGECLDEEECEVRWDETHDEASAAVKQLVYDMKGFFVKTGQIVATRQDLFPKQYSEALEGLTDDFDPMPSALARAVVQQELCDGAGERFEDVFESWVDEPLGSASVAQVHRAKLTAAYGGAEVAVKVQRPAIEAKLLSDLSTLKALAKAARDALPVDYYAVFCELETQLADEFDFRIEAASMARVAQTLQRAAPNAQPTLAVPEPIGALVSRRVLVMEYLDGVPLSRAAAEMRRRGIELGSPEAELFGRRLLRALSDGFATQMLRGDGLFHADPHPGNIMLLNDGRIGLIDFGQVKRLSAARSATLGKIMRALCAREKGRESAGDLSAIGELALELGVELDASAPPEGPAATAIFLFDGSVTELPGGYDTSELSPNSPITSLKAFPQELVLVARVTVLIKGIASRLGVTWSLADEWAAYLDGDDQRAAAAVAVPASSRRSRLLDAVGRRLDERPALRAKLATAALRLEALRSRRRARQKQSARKSAAPRA